MATRISEKNLVSQFLESFTTKFPNLVAEVVIPVISQIYYNNYLEGRSCVRIDLATIDFNKDDIIFIEAENGLYIQHPQVYLPFCNYLYVLSNRDNSPYRAKQLEWCKREGIGVIELATDGNFIETLEPRYHEIYPNIKAYVKSRIIKKLRRRRG